MSNTGLTRRTAVGVLASAALQPGTFTTPKGFHWGCATAAHQVEGSNVNSDFWVLENVKPTIFSEPSGDACDHYHRYPADIALVKSLGFNTYRFSVEWARIEPEPGMFSTNQLDHYRRMAETCAKEGLAPIATYNHFTVPRWMAARGGWENPESADWFARYCEKVTARMGDLLAGACTLNEPNLGPMLEMMKLPIPPQFIQAMLASAAKAVGSDKFGNLLFGDWRKALLTLLAAHEKGGAAIRAGAGKFPVGVTLAMSDDQAVGDPGPRDRKRAVLYGPWLELARKDEFIGVQTYTRSRVGPDGDLPAEAGVEKTDMGYEFWPEALEQTIRYAHAETKVPVLVTENGIGTNDDARRVEYLRRALVGMARAMKDGVPVTGYCHWSLLDNFEWFFGYRIRFGIVAVNRLTQERTVKPSGTWLGAIARSGKIPV